MKVTYIFLAFIGILMYNFIIAKRDVKLFKAYDSVCASLPLSNPNCRYSK